MLKYSIYFQRLSLHDLFPTVYISLLTLCCIVHQTHKVINFSTATGVAACSHVSQFFIVLRSCGYPKYWSICYHSAQEYVFETQNLVFSSFICINCYITVDRWAHSFCCALRNVYIGFCKAYHRIRCNRILFLEDYWADLKCYIDSKFVTCIPGTSEFVGRMAF